MEELVLKVVDLNVFFEDRQVVYDVNIDVGDKQVTALIGPSACGKTTILRAISRNLDMEQHCRIEGTMRLRDKDIYDPSVTSESVRKRVRYISQVPNLFDMSVRDNLYIPLRHWYPEKSRAEINEQVCTSLRRVHLDPEKREILDFPARRLSAGEQQKLALARGLCGNPDLLLLDEPTANMDPISVSLFEEIIDELREDVAVLMITHSLQQAARVSQRSAMMHLGILSEIGSTDVIFTNPRDVRTRDFITGRYG